MYYHRESRSASASKFDSRHGGMQFPFYHYEIFLYIPNLLKLFALILNIWLCKPFNFKILTTKEKLLTNLRGGGWVGNGCQKCYGALEMEGGDLPSWVGNRPSWGNVPLTPNYA